MIFNISIQTCYFSYFFMPKNLSVCCMIILRNCLRIPTHAWETNKFQGKWLHDLIIILSILSTFIFTANPIWIAHDSVKLISTFDLDLNCISVLIAIPSRCIVHVRVCMNYCLIWLFEDLKPRKEEYLIPLFYILIIGFLFTVEVVVWIG